MHNANGDECVKIFTCSFCDFHCYEHVALLRHIKDLHQNDPNFLVYCSYCGKTYKKWDSLRKHVQRQHSNSTCTVDDTEGKWLLWYFPTLFPISFITITADGLVQGWQEDDDGPDADDGTAQQVIACNEQWSNAQFLLHLSNEYSINHGKLDRLCGSVQSFSESVCKKIEDRLI